MRRSARTMTVILLAGVLAAHAAPGIAISSTVGANLSFLQVDKVPDLLNLGERSVLGYPLFGVSVDAHFNKYLGLKLGVMHERRGGKQTGSLMAGPWELGQGGVSYDYKYLDIPLHLKVIIPLLIPGDLYVSLGPELSITIQATRSGWQESAPESLTVDDQSLVTEPLDLGLGICGGYDLPVGKVLHIGLWVGYYIGFIDQSTERWNIAGEQQDFDLYTRSIRFGLSVSANVAR